MAWRADPVGFDLQYAGQQGQAVGNGLYFGLSDHITVRYNANSGYPPGTFIIGLMLMNEKTGWSHYARNQRHGGVTTVKDHDEEYSRMRALRDSHIKIPAPKMTVLTRA